MNDRQLHTVRIWAAFSLLLSLMPSAEHRSNDPYPNYRPVSVPKLGARPLKWLSGEMYCCTWYYLWIWLEHRGLGVACDWIQFGQRCHGLYALIFAPNISEDAGKNVPLSRSRYLLWPIYAVPCGVSLQLQTFPIMPGCLNLVSYLVLS